MPPSAAIEISQVAHCYGERQALDDVSLEVAASELFAFLGPNGGGKTTLFRLLSTLIPLQAGSIRTLGFDVAAQPHEVRRRIGVVFQAPSLDRKLTVAENLRHQGHLYGLSGKILAARVEEMLGRMRLEDRAGEVVERLSGGLRRRVELAKGMLHRPRILLLDEPSTGLDPGARSDLWAYLEQIRAEQGVTVALTTHLLDEADRADRLAILSAGSLVALDTPSALRATIGGETLSIETSDPGSLAAAIGSRFGLEANVVDETVRVEHPDAPRLVAQLMEAFGPEIQAVTVGRPTLEDVFIARTGHRFWQTPREEVSVG